MKKDFIGFLVFIDVVSGGVLVLSGVLLTFSQPWYGWMGIVVGFIQLGNFYFLVWGVEEILKGVNEPI